MLKHCSVLIDPINDAFESKEDILRFTFATSVSHASSERNGVRNNRSTTAEEEEEEDFEDEPWEEEGAADEAQLGDKGEDFLLPPTKEFKALARKRWFLRAEYLSPLCCEDRASVVVAFCCIIIADVVFIISNRARRRKSVALLTAFEFLKKMSLGFFHFSAKKSLQKKERKDHRKSVRRKNIVR